MKYLYFHIQLSSVLSYKEPNLNEPKTDGRNAVRTKRNEYTAELKRYGLVEEANNIDRIFGSAPFCRFCLGNATSRAILLANWRLGRMAAVYYTAIVDHLKGLYQSDLTKHFGGHSDRLDEWATKILVNIQSELKQQKSPRKLLDDASIVEMFEHFEKALRLYREEVGTFLSCNFNSTDNAF